MNPCADQHVWTERFDRDLRDVFEAQEQIANLIVAGVRKKLAAVSPLYLEGLGGLKRFTRILLASRATALRGRFARTAKSGDLRCNGGLLRRSGRSRRA